MSKFTDGLMTGAGNAAGGVAVGQLGGLIGQGQQMNNSEALMNMGIRGSKELAKYNSNLALQYWKDTNYSEQMEELQKAGLNAGLMYKSGGAGGSTINPSGNASAPNTENYGMKGAEMMMNETLKQAQIDNITADTNKKNIEADKIAGADTDNTVASTGYMNAQTTLTNFNAGIAKINEDIAKNTQVDAEETIQSNCRKAIAEMEIAETNADISQETKQDEIDRIGYESIGAMLKNKATIAGIKLTDRQTSAITEQLTQGFINAYANKRNSEANKTSADTNVLKQISDSAYQSGLIKLGNDKLTQDMIFGIGNLVTGQMPSTSTVQTIEDIYDKSGKHKGSKESNRTIKKGR